MHPTLDLLTVRLYNYDFSKDENKGTIVGEESYTVLYNPDSNRLTVKVPDGKAFVLEYEYTIDPNFTSDVKIHNDSSLSGKWSSEKDQVLVDVSSSAEVTLKTLTIYKVDSTSSNTFLPGVTFELNKFDKSSHTWELVQEETTKEKSEGDKGGYIKWPLSGADKFLEEDTLYKLTETKAVEGYKIEEPDYYFIWMNEHGDPDTAKDNAEVNNENSGITRDKVNTIANSGGIVQIENMPIGVSVKKIWQDKNENDLTDDEIEKLDVKKVSVTLYRRTDEEGEDAEFNDKVELNSENKWSNTWQDLPSKDENGKDYYYYVKEVSMEDEDDQEITAGYTTSYTNNGGIQNGKINVINKEMPVSIRVHKTWQDKDGNEITDSSKIPDNITLKLYRYKNADKSDLDYENSVATAKIGSTHDADGKTWEYTWTNEALDSLPGTEIGMKYYYVVKEFNDSEDELKGYTTLYNDKEESEFDGIKSGDIEITNQQKTTDVTVKKLWQDKDGQALEFGEGEDKAVTVKIFQHSEADLSDDETYIDEIVLNKANDRTHTWDDLSDSDKNGNAYYYTAKEDPEVEGYNVKYSNNGVGVRDGETITITNQQKTTDVTVKKLWQDKDGQALEFGEGEDKAVTVKIFQHSEADLSDDETYIDEIVLNKANDRTHTWDDLSDSDKNGNAYYYTAKEDPEVEGYNVKYSNNGVGVRDGETITITNQQKTTDITVKKLWQDSSGKTISAPKDAKIMVKLIQHVSNAPLDEGTEINAVELNDGNGRTHTWFDLALNDKNGNVYYYTVEESIGIDGYKALYKNNDGIKNGEIKIINKKSKTENPNKPEKPSENEPNGKDPKKNVKTGIVGVGSVTALLVATSALYVTSKKKKM